MSASIEEIEKLLDRKLKPITDELNGVKSELSNVSRDLAQIRNDLGYNNLRLIKDDKEEM
ncbi:MAG: hypothetical protein AAF363_05915 [Bacteroidota bacterium]